MVTIDNVSKFRDLYGLMTECKKKMNIPDIDISDYGFQTKQQLVLISDISDIDKSKKGMVGEKHLQDKDYFDNNLVTDLIVLRNLQQEAMEAVNEITTITKEIGKSKGLPEKERIQKEKIQVGKVRRISYNVRSQIEKFVLDFVACDGIKEIMKLIDTSDHNVDMIVVCCQMLSNIFAYNAGIDYITSKARKYLEKFFYLSSINEHTKKQCIRIFFNIAKSKLPDQFGLIEKAAVAYAKESKTIAFQTLIQGFGYINDEDMAMTLLKFINEMIFQAEQNEVKEAKFVAKLESLQINDLLKRWFDIGNEDIQE